MRVIRVFPRRTKATPIDSSAYIGSPDLFAEADSVHISVTFTYDLQMAEILATEWKHVAPVEIGGPGVGTFGNDFTPGMYLKPGYVITSRGCPNTCWFCEVWKRDGNIRELPITEGYNVLDDNLFACSDEHIKAVFRMLQKQPQKAEFTGGLEAVRLKPWHVEELYKLKPKQMFFAYDTWDDLEPLIEAGRLLLAGGFTTRSHVLRCYVLIGYLRDTFEDAETRLRETITAGFFPMAMLYRDKVGQYDKEWRQFQRQWARPEIIAAKIKEKK